MGSRDQHILSNDRTEIQISASPFQPSHRITSLPLQHQFRIDDLLNTLLTLMLL
jgi:hypothetical protein